MLKALAATALAIALSTSNSCEIKSPCEDMSAPSDRERKAWEYGGEVEREVDDTTTCELSGDGETWVEDD